MTRWSFASVFPAALSTGKLQLQCSSSIKLCGSRWFVPKWMQAVIASWALKEYPGQSLGISVLVIAELFHLVMAHLWRSPLGICADRSWIWALTNHLLIARMSRAYMNHGVGPCQVLKSWHLFLRNTFPVLYSCSVNHGHFTRNPAFVAGFKIFHFLPMTSKNRGEIFQG